jgi:hypothetical protein
LKRTLIAAILCLAATAALAQATTPTSVTTIGELIAPWLQVLLAATAGLIVALLGWLTTIINKKANLENDVSVLAFEAHMRDALQTALNNAAGLIQQKATTTGVFAKPLDVGSPELLQGLKYVTQAAPDALKHFGLDEDQLRQRLLAKLGQLNAPGAIAS